MFECLAALIEVNLEVADLFIVSCDLGRSTFTQIHHFLRLPLLVTPFQKVLLEVEVSFLVATEITVFLQKALDGDLGVIDGEFTTTKLRGVQVVFAVSSC